MNPAALNALSFGIVGLSAVTVSVRLLLAYRRAFHESHLLSQAAGELLRERRFSAPLKLSLPPLRSLWSTLLQSVHRQPENQAPSLEQLSSLSQTLHTTYEDAASGVVKAILDQCQPEAAACALVVCGEGEGLRLEACEGIPRRRIEEALLGAVESALTWGFQSVPPGHPFDLSVFDIGASFLTPLIHRESGGATILGYLWIGFARSAYSIPPERRSFVEAVVSHALSAFRVAHTLHRERLSREEEKRFLLEVSHDLRSPGVGALYLLREIEGECNPELSERVALLKRSLEEQQQMIQDFLDYSRHEKGVLPTHRTLVSLRSLLEEIVWRYSCQEKVHHLSLTVEHLPELFLSVDPRQIKRALSNILSNAVKYTDAGGVSLSFKEGERFLEIRVADTGVGIAEEETELLFQEFSRLPATASRPGTGLGLAITKALIENNQGYLRYEPNPGGGSIFIIGLELAPICELPLGEAAP